jgi:DMSO/TMAO reductase YedYZ molybdopterin-dependent catalytic subunit
VPGGVAPSRARQMTGVHVRYAATPVNPVYPERTQPPLDPSGPFSRPPLKPHELTEPVTPTRDLFVLAHLAVPRVDPSTWTLKIDGLVRRERSCTLDELRRYP